MHHILTLNCRLERIGTRDIGLSNVRRSYSVIVLTAHIPNALGSRCSLGRASVHVSIDSSERILAAGEKLPNDINRGGFVKAL